MTAGKVGLGANNLLNPFGTQWSKSKATEAKTIGQQIQNTLFARPPPQLLDPSQIWRFKRQLGLLKKFRRKIVTILGDDDEEYPLLLARGQMAMIDADGNVYMGDAFLEEEGDSPEILVGALGHEIGHRPKDWSSYRMEYRLTRDEISQLCRNEESKADAFAGLALAELQLSPEPLVSYLRRVQDRPHPEYFPVDVRADILRESCKSRAFRAEMRKKLFPGVDRLTSPKNHLGDF